MSDKHSIIGHDINGYSMLDPLMPSWVAAAVAAPQLIEEARAYAREAKSANTRRAYLSDWRDFQDWCTAQALSACPAAAETLALYLTHLARTRKPSTLNRRLAAISQYHQAMGQISPAGAMKVRTVMVGIRRKKGTARQRKKPLLASVLAKVAQNLPDTLLGVRNRALLLIGFAGAFRRGELVALDWDRIEAVSEGLRVVIAKSKTDQAGEGRLIGIPLGENPATCPVRALEAWRKAGSFIEGPVFRVVGRAGKVMRERLSDKAVARVVKGAVQAAGLIAGEFSAHSLRSGLATSAAMAGVSERYIMLQTGHKDLKTARGYIREGSLFRENAAGKLGL